MELVSGQAWSLNIFCLSIKTNGDYTWSLDYKYFSSQAEVTENFKADLKVNYSSLEIGLGAKHYMFLNSRSKFFVTASYVMDVPVNSRVIFLGSDRNLDPELTDFNSKANIVLGLGYKNREKYIVELKYGLPRDVSGFRVVPENYYLDWRTDYSYLTIMLGYSIF